MSDEIPSRSTMQPASDSTRVTPVVARGPAAGAAIGGALASVGAALMAVPFPLPWVGPLVGAIVVGVGVALAAWNGVQLNPSDYRPPR